MAKRSSKELVNSQDFKPTPLVQMKKLPEGKDSIFISGVLSEPVKEHETKFKDVRTGQKSKEYIYTMKIKDGNAPLALKGEDGKYRPLKQIEADSEVAIFATEVLHKKLVALSAQVGELVTIVYRGKKQNQKTGFNFHDYEVEVG